MRVSTQRQEQGISLATQRDAIATGAKARGDAIAHEYVDILSGTREDRPRYQAMLREMEPGDTIYVWRLDRIGRNKAELFRFFDEIKRRRITLVSVTQPDLSNELVRDIMSVLAAYESQQIAERVLPTMARTVEQGKWVTRIPRWYAMGSDGHLVPGPDAADAQKVWESVLSTGSIEEAAARFGINTVTLQAALRRRVYLGETVWNGIVIPGTHEPIVKRETWEAVERIRAARRKDRRRVHHGTALLTGFLYVEDTDRRLYHYQRTVRGATRRYYVTTDGSHLPRHSVRAADAERAVVDALKTLALTPAQKRALEGDLRERARGDPHRRERAALHRRLTMLDREEVETARMEAQRRIAPVVADRMRAEQSRERAGVAARLEALPPLTAIKDAAPLLALRIGLADHVERAYGDRDWPGLRILVEAFIARVEVYGGLATRHQWRQRDRRIVVRWNAANVMEG